MGIIDIMAAPFAECMVLVAIHTYLGIHVLRRRVIFVDLALAQTAALGTTVGFLFGILPDTTAALIFSMLFTFIGAAIFALTRIPGERVPQEAVIGLFYAIMAASAVLVVQKTHGAEHMDDILVGSILWVSWQDVLTAAVAYGLVGVVHYVFRKQFFFISENPDEAFRQGINVKAWDFLFYLTFGFVISFSVRVAGVLLVFVFLVAPAIMAFIITRRLKAQLLIGWTMGTIVTVLGLYLSYAQDLPSGPTVVAFYGIALAAGALSVYVIRSKRKGAAIKWIAVGSATAAAVALGVYGVGTRLAASDLAKSEAHQKVAAKTASEREEARAAERAEARTKTERLKGWFNRISVPEAVSASTLLAYAQCEDDEQRLALIRDEMNKQGPCGLALLAYFLASDETPEFFRSEGVDLLKQLTGKDFGYKPELGSAANMAAIQRLIKERMVHE